MNTRDVNLCVNVKVLKVVVNYCLFIVADGMGKKKTKKKCLKTQHSGEV